MFSHTRPVFRPGAFNPETARLTSGSSNFAGRRGGNSSLIPGLRRFAAGPKARETATPLLPVGSALGGQQGWREHLTAGRNNLIMPAAQLPGARAGMYEEPLPPAMKFATLRPRIEYFRSRQARVVYVLMGLTAALGLVWALWQHHALVM